MRAFLSLLIDRPFLFMLLVPFAYIFFFPMPDLRKPSPVRESLVLHVEKLSRNVHEGHLKEIFSMFNSF